jgi:hypothetical protein
MIKAGELPVLQLGSMKRIPLAAVIALEAQCEQQTDATWNPVTGCTKITLPEKG